MGINVLSLCDGMSCCQIALDKLGISVDNYYSSEIDKYAMKVTNENYPKTEQLGDITNLGKKELESLPEIDLLIAGTPCKNLSKSVINRGEYNQGLEGEKSKLFYDYARVLKWIKNNNNDKVKFVLENVNSMNNEDKQIITDVLKNNSYKTKINYNDHFITDNSYAIDEIYNICHGLICGYDFKQIWDKAINTIKEQNKPVNEYIFNDLEKDLKNKVNKFYCDLTRKGDYYV